MTFLIANPRPDAGLPATFLLFPLLLAAATTVWADDPAPVQRHITIVDCDQTVRSPKRGVCANKLSPEDFRALAPGVSWYYNWNFAPGDTGTPPPGVQMDFVPMVWGDGPDKLTGLRKYLAAGNRPRAILGINEPNLSEQSFLTPEKAAELFGKIKSVADGYSIPVVGPQMSIGSPPNMSITAQDPIEHKPVTYTYMEPYLKAFNYYLAQDHLVMDGFGLHPYMNAGGLIGLTDAMHQEFQKPVWVTEYNLSDDSASMEDTATYLIKVVDFLERQPYVQGYAFFKERFSGHEKASLLEDAPGALTPLGKIYLEMPVHEPDLYYRIPGRLQAEDYATLDREEIWPTSDVDGFLHMTSNVAGSSLNYSIQVAKPGTYRLGFRVTGAPGTISVLEGNRVLGTASIDPTLPRWATVYATVPLPSGLQSLTVRSDAAGIGINWIEFAKG